MKEKNEMRTDDGDTVDKDYVFPFSRKIEKSCFLSILHKR